MNSFQEDTSHYMADHDPYIEGKKWVYFNVWLTDFEVQLLFKSPLLLSHQPCWIWLDFTSQPSADVKVLISIFPRGYIDERSLVTEYISYTLDNFWSWWDLRWSLFSGWSVLRFREGKKALIGDATSGEKKSSRYLKKPLNPHQKFCQWLRVWGALVVN